VECSRGQTRGWYRDPFGRHQDRYFSEGSPTKLVRDAGVESYDPPPRGRRVRRPLVPVVAAPHDRGRRDLRRADDAQREWAFDPCRKAIDAITRFGSFG
jgi:hypothetical protein